MRHHSEGHPDAIGTWALVIMMLIFGAGVLYAGASLREPSPTTQLAVAFDP